MSTVIERAGLRLDKSQYDQLYQAIKKLAGDTVYKAKAELIKELRQKLTKSENGADIPDKNQFLKNLGIPGQLDARQPLNPVLTALAQLDGEPGNSADNLPYFSAKNTVLTTALTAFMRTLLGKTNAADVLSLLGAKTAALRDVGTGANQIPDMSAFPFACASVGWMKLPSAFMIQWGRIGIGAGDVTTNFPVAFPVACLCLTVSQDYTPTSGSVGYIAGSQINRSQFVSRCSSAYLGAFYMAIGY